jgi:CHAT domain-containing protein
MNDQVAVALVAGTIELQNSGDSTAEALRRVQRALIAGSPGRSDLGHPFYWAPLVLIGDGRRATAARS